MVVRERVEARTLLECKTELVGRYLSREWRHSMPVQDQCQENYVPQITPRLESGNLCNPWLKRSLKHTRLPQSLGRRR